MLKRTKIVATISDRRCDTAFIQALFDAGMNVARLNTAHMNPETAKSVITRIREVSEHIAILVDTKGPEIRTSSLGVDVRVEKGGGCGLSVIPGGSRGAIPFTLATPELREKFPWATPFSLTTGSWSSGYLSGTAPPSSARR